MADYAIAMFKEMYGEDATVPPGTRTRRRLLDV